MFRLDAFRPATIIGVLPNTIANGQTADAVPLMADLNHIVNQVNANAAELSLTPQLANANSFTAVQSGVAATAAANFPIASQVQNASLTTLSSVAGDNTITARVSGFTLGAYTRGQIFSFVPAAGNSGSASINIDALGATTIFKEGGRTLSSDDLAVGKTAFIRYRTPLEALASGFDLLNPGFSISGSAYRNAGDILVGTGGAGFNSTLAVGSNFTLPFASAGVASRIAWLSLNQLPLASSIDVTNDMMLLRSNSLGTHARVSPRTFFTAGNIILGTPVASTSGTAIDFTAIPAGTKRIIIMFVGVSTNGTSNFLVQIGDAGGIEAATYTSVAATDGGTRVTSTAGLIVSSSIAAAATHTGKIVLDLEDSTDFTWVSQGLLADSSPLMNMSAGSKSLDAELDRVRITMVNGSDTFDAGEINISYE